MRWVGAWKGQDIGLVSHSFAADDSTVNDHVVESLVGEG